MDYVILDSECFTIQINNNLQVQWGYRVVLAECQRSNLERWKEKYTT